MFNKLIGQSKAERGEVYLSAPNPKPEVVIEEKTPVMTIHATALCRFKLNKERDGYGHLIRAHGLNHEKRLYEYEHGEYIYQLILEFCISYMVNGIEYSLNSSSLLGESPRLSHIQDLVENKHNEGGKTFMEILESHLKYEIPKVLKKQKEDVFLEEFQKIGQFKIEFSVEVEEKN